MRTGCGRAGRVRLAVVVAAASAVAGVVNGALAFPNEPEGFEGLRWGATAGDVLKARKNLVRKGYRLAAVQKALREAAGIYLDEDLPSFLGFPNATARYFLGKQGLYRVDVTLEDTNPRNMDAARRLRDELAARYGAGDADPTGRVVWKGERSVVVLAPEAVAVGVRLRFSVVRAADYRPED